LIDSPRYGWVVVAAAFTLMFVGFGAAYSFAAFFSAFESEFGASRGEIALVFSLCAFLWFSSGAPAGMLADRFGARRVAIAGVVFAALGMLGAAFAAPRVAVPFFTGWLRLEVHTWSLRGAALLCIWGVVGGAVGGRFARRVYDEEPELPRPTSA